MLNFRKAPSYIINSVLGWRIRWQKRYTAFGKTDSFYNSMGCAEILPSILSRLYRTDGSYTRISVIMIFSQNSQLENHHNQINFSILTSWLICIDRWLYFQYKWTNSMIDLSFFTTLNSSVTHTTNDTSG